MVNLGHPDLRRRVELVVRSDNCSGCGACATLSSSISMELDDDGYLRPQIAPDYTPVGRQVSARFSKVCPGAAVTSARTSTVPEHPILGPHVSAWSAWAQDPELRWAGSSGGVLSALSAWMLDAGIANTVVGAAMSTETPRRTVPLELRTRADVLSATGSRYAPVGNTELFDPDDPGRAFVGKPCEAYAARRLIETRSTKAVAAPVLLSFFCAGVPAQKATDELVTTLDVDSTKVVSVRYRGNGSPGDFAVVDAAGNRASMSYEQSWGNHLGTRLQERCKICPDGTGGHADIAVGDYWRADASGFPTFKDAAGMSVAIARTPRGHRLLIDAEAAGVLGLGPVDLDDVAAVQPLQVRRHLTLLGRLVGRVAAGRRVPRFRRFGLLRLAVGSPKDTYEAAKGTFGRTRRRRRQLATAGAGANTL
jgi:coenzyme F420 hydrogenase subunit beta